MFYRLLRAMWARTIQTNNTKSEGDGDKEDTSELSGGSWFMWQRRVQVIYDTHLEGGALWSDPSESLVAKSKTKNVTFPGSEVFRIRSG